MAIGTNPYSVEYESTNVSAALATTLIASNPTTSASSYLVLHSITINTKGATGNTLTVYDSLTAAGRIIALIDTTAGVQSLFYDAICRIGITVISATGTGGDITVNWTKARA